MSKISKISGFPEWLPAQKLVEEQIITRIREVYQRAGFVPIETPAVELLSTLQAKGTVEKEIYVLRRLHAEASENDQEQLALHFDLTVPFARYVAQHFSAISFPFKRYQLQKVWRGERPQKGRYREFYQFDIDVVCRDDLPLACDAEALDVYAEALTKLGLPEYEIRINDRRVLLGFYKNLGLDSDQQKKAISIVDKLNKVGEKGVAELLRNEISLNQSQIDQILNLSKNRCKGEQAREFLAKFTGSSTPASDSTPCRMDLVLENAGDFETGISSLIQLLDLVSDETRSRIVIDFSLARGLDYYTGLILEVVMNDYPEFGSIGAGGRYENLASDFTSQKLPGVGFSIGISRILGFLFDEKKIELPPASLTKVLVSVFNEEQRSRCNQVARDLRKLGVAAEVYFKSPKLGKQLDFADGRGIPYVVFVNAENGSLQVKDLKTKEQSELNNLSEFAARINAQ